jgi:hypothetical protein
MYRLYIASIYGDEFAPNDFYEYGEDRFFERLIKNKRIKCNFKYDVRCILFRKEKDMNKCLSVLKFTIDALDRGGYYKIVVWHVHNISVNA